MSKIKSNTRTVNVERSKPFTLTKKDIIKGLLMAVIGSFTGSLIQI